MSNVMIISDVMETIARSGRESLINEAIERHRRNARCRKMFDVMEEAEMAAIEVREINSEYDTTMALLSMRRKILE